MCELGVGTQYPAIAQLVERLTVEVTQLSGGPWFESGLPEYFLFLKLNQLNLYLLIKLYN